MINDLNMSHDEFGWVLTLLLYSCHRIMQRIRGVHNLPPTNTIDGVRDRPPPGPPAPPSDAYALVVR